MRAPDQVRGGIRVTAVPVLNRDLTSLEYRGPEQVRCGNVENQPSRPQAGIMAKR
jgi:hypothetical protein